MARRNIDIVSTNSEYNFSSLVSGVTVSNSALNKLYVSNMVKKIKYSSTDDSLTVFLKDEINYEDLKWEQ